MELKKALTRELFEKSKTKLLALDDITVMDIRARFICRGDKEYSDEYIAQENLPYDWRDPLYMKHIHRFRNCGCRFAVFYHQLDPSTQRHLSMYYLNSNEMLEFLAWISNMLGSYNITDMYNDLGAEDVAAKILLWKTRPIEFFFDLPEFQQNKLIAKYNKDEIENYNDFCNSKN